MDQPTIPPSQQPPKHPLTIPPGMGDLNYLQSLLSAVNLQELFPASSPTFVGLTLSGLTASLPIVTNASKALASVTYATFKASLAIAQADVAGLTTASSPTFAGLTLTAFSGFVKATAGVLSAGAIAAGDLPAHVLDGAVHTVSGLTGGHFLKATGATTFGFAAHGLTYSDVGAEASGAVATHAALITGVHGLVFTAGKALTLQKSMTLTAADDTGVYTFPTGAKTLLATDGSPAAMVIASQATGDLLYASSATAWARLSIGAAGKALVVNALGTLPEWGTVLTNPMDAAGELIYGGDGSGTPAALAAGAATTILVGGGAAAPVWTTATGTGAPVRAGNPSLAGATIVDSNLYFIDSDVAHGITDYFPTNVCGVLYPVDGATGGLRVFGLSDSDQTALILMGVIGSDNPTDTTPAIYLEARKKSGTTGQALAAAETVLQIKNYGTNLLTVLGSGNVGIGTTAPPYLLSVSKPTAANNALDYTVGFMAGADATLGPMQLIFQLYPSATGSSRYATIAPGDNVAWRNLILCPTSGNVGIGTTAPTSPLQVVGLPSHNDNAAAKAAGLTDGALYRYALGGGYVMVVYT